jgi:hypothetical protein
MKIPMKKFGTILVSRPAGHEAFLAASAYILTPPPNDSIELDFEGVKVLAPSWADEFLSGLKKNFKNPIKILPTNNSSVIESLKILEEP